MKKKGHYINNEDLESVISLYQSDSKKYEKELISMFGLLIKNIIESFKFQVDPNDAKQECFALILKTVPKFDSNKGKAFNYFTTIILNHLKLMWRKEKKYQEKINAYIEIKKGDLE